MKSFALALCVWAAAAASVRAECASCATCVGGRCVAAGPERSVVVRRAGQPVRNVARAAVVLPARAVKQSAAWVQQHRPVRRAVRATARVAPRVAAAPVRLLARGVGRVRCR